MCWYIIRFLLLSCQSARVVVEKKKNEKKTDYTPSMQFYAADQKKQDSQRVIATTNTLNTV